MRTVFLSLLVIGGVMATMPQRVSAVNCDQVRRYLSTGRSVEDVAETMIVDVEAVKKCQQGGGEQQGGQQPAPTPAAGGKQNGQ